MIDSVVWDGLNIREVSAMCRDLLQWNAEHPTTPKIWYTGRSRIAPQTNTVTIRTARGLVKVRAGDTIRRDRDGEYSVRRAGGNCPRCDGVGRYNRRTCVLCDGTGTMAAAVESDPHQVPSGA